MIRSKNKRIVLLALICAVLCLFGLLGFGGSSLTARAEDTIIPGVITDLSRDPNFNAADYPEIPGDYSIDLFQIAEGENDKLFAYFYIPCRTVSDPKGREIDLSPTEVSLSMDTNISAMTYKLYGLTEISRKGALYKYVVNGVKVDTSLEKRYYSISMLQRKWSVYVPEIGEDVREKEFPVQKLWTAETTAEGVLYTETHKDTIEILNPIAGAVRYLKNKVPANWGTHAVDSHFVAFNTDLPIDDLLEADVSYMTVSVGNAPGYFGSPSVIVSVTRLIAELALMQSEGFSTANKTKDEVYAIAAKRAAEKYGIKPAIVTIKKENTYTFETGGNWFTSNIKYTWNQIQGIDEFKGSLQDGKIVCLSGGKSSDLESRQWILRYRETPYDDKDIFLEHFFEDVGGYWYDFDIVTLRLKFETNGEVFDMGTVSDKVDQTLLIQGNTAESLWDKFLAWVKKIMAWLFGISADSIPDWAAILFLVGVVFILGLLVRLIAPFMPLMAHFIVAGAKGFAKGFVGFFKGLFYVLSLPVRGIIALIRRKRGGE